MERLLILAAAMLFNLAVLFLITILLESVK